MQTPRSAQLQKTAAYIRTVILRATAQAGSGHASSALSAVELLTVLMFGGHFRADLKKPLAATNDRLIFSKGHAAPLLYALYCAAGVVREQELNTLRTYTSRLEGHPSVRFPYTEVPTGSLGQGLSAGVGMALHATMHELPYRTFILLGDGEMSEGSVWEAMQFAGNNKLHNLVGILDVNRLGQTGPTPAAHNLRVYERRCTAFGWRTVTVDGHNIDAIHRAYKTSVAATSRPVMILAKTLKGKGVPIMENKNGWHGKPLTPEQLQKAVQQINAPKDVRAVVRAAPVRTPPRQNRKRARAPRYQKQQPVATRKAIANALVRLAAAFPEMVVLDGDVANSTYTETFAQRYPQRFVQGYIAEQNIAGMAAGLAARGSLPVSATFAAFWTRAHDQLRMNQYAGTHQVYVGTHAGVAVGKDGFSQMGLEDIALFRSLFGCTVVYPADAYAAERLVEQALQASGMVYVRGTRGATPIVYDAGTTFVLGGSHTLFASKRDDMTIVAAGVTVFEALKAAVDLQKLNISVRVIDLYSIQPVDVVALKKAARETRHLVVVEDHKPAGGIAEAVRAALAKTPVRIDSLAVTHIPRSGRPDDLLRQQGIDAQGIIRAVLAQQKRGQTSSEREPSVT